MERIGTLRKFVDEWVRTLAGAALLALSGTAHTQDAEHSVARRWNDVLLEAIRNDFARPTVHARNLFHTSVAMWDAWAAYDTSAVGYCHNEWATSSDVEAARRVARAGPVVQTTPRSRPHAWR